MIAPCGKTAVGSAVFYFSPCFAVGAFPHIVLSGTVSTADHPQRIVKHRGRTAIAADDPQCTVKHRGSVKVPCGKTGVGCYLCPGDAVGAFPYIVQILEIEVNPADDPQRTVKHRGSMTGASGKTGGGCYLCPGDAFGAFPHIVFVVAGTVKAADDPQRILGIVLTPKHRGSMKVPCGKNRRRMLPVSR
ncbi:hypothetical protein CHS0354_018435 [Potamilus streckersoni]|uniref:Uncharacterized protein n=1 Tax=Potamilus streckersoni TaxID=2493646 RepID=A0AAE0W9X6_9BIVA|nr:hypothetical protein CHS0354_018435 [Potamilus streckersoni]